MQITALNVGIKDKERVNVFIDGKFRIAVDQNTLVQEHLFIGKEIDNESIAKLKDLDTYNYLSRKIINWIYIRPRSSKEITDKLKNIISDRKSSSFNSSIDINQLSTFVLDKLSVLGFDNRKFAIWLIENRFNQAKYGKQRVYTELLSKGVYSGLAKELINEYYPEDASIAQDKLLKKFGVTSIKEIKDQKTKQKAYRFLISKGFRIP